MPPPGSSSGAAARATRERIHADVVRDAKSFAVVLRETAFHSSAGANATAVHDTGNTPYRDFSSSRVGDLPIRRTSHMNPRRPANR